MAKDASLFTILNKSKESKIYVIDDFSLDVVGQVDVSCRHGKIVDIHHVPNISANMFYVSQSTQKGKIMEFWSDWLHVLDLKKGNSIIIGELLDPMENLYNFHDTT
jgi:hypothetical protein